MSREFANRKSVNDDLLVRLYLNIFLIESERIYKIQNTEKETSLSRKELEKRIRKGDTVEFSHTLSSIISNLLSKGFVLDGFFSDSSGFESVDSFVRDSYLAFKAIKSR